MIRKSLVAAGCGQLVLGVWLGFGVADAAAADPLLQRATQVFETAFAGTCLALETGDEEAPEAYPIRYTEYDAADAPTVEAHLFRFLCGRGAYNLLDVYILADPYGAVAPVGFASPDLDIRYADENWEQVEALAIVGYKTDHVLVNSEFDPATLTVTANARWRGLGDAYSAGTWVFHLGSFSLVRFEVDASFDGEITPEVVVDFPPIPR